MVVFGHFALSVWYRWLAQKLAGLGFSVALMVFGGWVGGRIVTIYLCAFNPFGAILQLP